MQDPGLSSDDDEEYLKQNALDVLMQPPSKKLKGVDIDPIAIAVIYIRWLKWIDPSEPLYMCPYGGQAVRTGNTAEEVALERWTEENRDAARKEKSIGLLACIRIHGAEAFHNEIVDWMRGPRSEVQQWADKREVALIAQYGGPLRDPSVRCKQTLNLTKGGKGHCNFEAIDTSRTVSWLHFQDEMQEYIECYGTSLVPTAYVNPVSGYKLGGRLRGVRRGELCRGHPDEAKRVEWLESLPDWAWKAMETDEWRNAVSERTKARWTNASEETRAEWAQKNSEAHNRPEVKAAASERAKKHFESQEARDALSKRSKAQWANADDETRAEWIERITEANNRPDVKKKHSDSAKVQAKREREADPEYRSRRAKTQMTQPEALERQSKNATEWWQNATQEQLDRMESSRKKTVASSRERRMEGMTESQRKSEVATQKSNQRKDARKKRQLLALRQVPGWEKAHNRDIPKARLAGVLPSID